MDLVPGGIPGALPVRPVPQNDRRGLAPASATAYITADTFYRLWINGQLVMHGPARSSRGKATVDAVDVGRHLAQGRNTLMIEVFHGVCPFEALAQAPGLLCELEADFGGQKAILAATDATWEAAEITAWSRKSLKFNYQRGWTEQFDARRTLEEKSQPAIVLGKVGTAPWLKVEPRDIPLPAPLVEVRPASVVAVQRGDGYAADFHGPETRIEPKAEWDERSAWFRRLHTEHLTADPAAAKNPQGLTKEGQGDAVLQGDGAGISYDLGRGYVGFVGFEVTGQAGQVIEVVWNDRLSGDGAVRPCAQTGRNALQFTLRDGRQSFLAFMPQFARFLRISQRGPGEVTVHRLALTEFRFAAEPKGDFVCSDEELNRIYQAARWTAALNTLDAYMDCPHRERNAMYGVEGYWMQKAVYPMFGDTSVSRRSILCAVDSLTDPEGTAGPPDLIHIAYPMHLKFFNAVIPTQPLFWVLHAGLYERCSGDTELIRTVLPVIRRNLAAMDGWRNSDGLLESIPCWMFFDYADIRTDGASVTLNGVYARTLDEAARLERLAGEAPRADAFEKQAQQVRDSLNRLCTGDTFYPDVLARDPQQKLVPSREACETTQYFVLWGGVPSPDRQQRMWAGPARRFPAHAAAASPADPGADPRWALPLPATPGGGRAAGRPRRAGPRHEGHVPAHGRQPARHLVGRPHGRDCPLSQHRLRSGRHLDRGSARHPPGIPSEDHAAQRRALQSCRGFITTPKGRVHLAWELQKDRYQLQASLPKDVTAEVILPPEAKAVWQAAPATSPWRETLTVSGEATIVVAPGKVETP